ncbi:Nramp family divalent metal transporter [Bosea sp. ASV33]|uniref:Nramp family divalent metal transporter n=1 Tax=Bosea sp. ASV33 TaxID=2795106 RepID=UPI0018EC5D44|nr:Nramp family divalent metal transporter [Bosea sp. ASV33]
MTSEVNDSENPNPVVGTLKPHLLDVLGPGLITGAADDDPSGIATYSQAGAQFGFGIIWTVLFSYPLMAAIQEISARIGRTTGHGIATNLREHYPSWLLTWIVALLFVANIINIGADLGAMRDAVGLLIGGQTAIYVVFFAVVSACLQIFSQYTRYLSVLKWLTFSLFAYFGTVMFVKIPFGELARGLFIPTLSGETAFWTTVVAILGTTISPYLFFWQASQEVEDEHAMPKREALVDAPEQSKRAFARIRIDTYVGMGFSSLVALAIMVTTAATLHVDGTVDIQTSSQAAEALKPVAGRFAFTIFALGIIGTGLLAIPVLAGSAAYALGEARKWPIGLARQPMEAKAFYATITLATLVGTAVDFSPIDPIKALYWSAVINGIVSCPVMVTMMRMTRRADIMGTNTIGGPLQRIGWLATVVMTAAVAGMIWTSFR